MRKYTSPHAITALALAVVLLAPPATIPQGAGFLSGITGPYRGSDTPPIQLSDSSRLNSLVRAGNLYLSLQDAIALALENNLDIEYQRYGFRIADAGFRRTKAGSSAQGVSTQIQQGASSAATQALGGFTESSTGGFSGGFGGSGSQLDPVMSFEYGWSHNTSPQTNTVTTGGRTATTFDNTGIIYGISKGFTTGPSASLSWSSNSTLSDNPENNFNPSIGANIGLRISQSLLNGFGASYRRNIRIARNSLDVTDLVFRNQVIQTVTNIVGLYWDLVSYSEEVRVNQEALALAEQLLRDNEIRVKAGALAPIDVVNARAQVASRRQQVALSEGNLQQQEKILKNQLSRTGLDNPLLALVRVVPTDRLEIPSTEAVQPVQDLISVALNNRPDLLQSEIALENAQISLQASAESLRPSLDVYTLFRNSALAGQSNPLRPGSPDPFFVGGYGTALGQLLRRNFPNYEFGFSFTIPLRNRVAREGYTISSLQLRQQELNRRRQVNGLRVEVENALIALDQARIRYDAAVEERSLREQVLAAEETRYTLGVSQSFFVIQYQTDLARAQSEEVSALSTYVKAKVDLDEVIGRTLEAFNISIEEARDGRVSTPPTPLPAE